ncbi:MAG: hypothetical protein KDD04_10045, partial [Sinomicrobium sp.]|nr:hypothetical protein [Sinomicrobium sp.]
MSINKLNSNNHFHNVSPFPLEVLPPALQSFIRIACKADSMMIDYLAAAILGAASIAIGRTHLVEVDAGMVYPGQLSLVLVGAP